MCKKIFSSSINEVNIYVLNINVTNIVNRYKTFDNIVDNANFLNQTARFDSDLSEEDANETEKYGETNIAE